MNLNIVDNQMNKSLNDFKDKLSTLNIGRANPKMVESILVNAYDSIVPIKDLANISIPESKTILISVWDSNSIKSVVKAINESNLGFNPIQFDNSIKISMPI